MPGQFSKPPPRPADLPLPWATWQPQRSPEFKVHNTLGAAKNALSKEGRFGERQRPDGTRERPIQGGILYKLGPSGWEEVAVLPTGSFKDDHPLWTHAKKWQHAPGITTVITENPFEA